MTSVAAASLPKSAAPEKARRKSTPSEHPGVGDMVEAAIGALKDRKGSSVIAIKKYIQSNFKGIEMSRLAPHIKRHVKKSVVSGNLIQTKGAGASGSFRINAKAMTPKKDKKAKKAKKTKVAKKAKSLKKKEKKEKKAAKPKAKKPKAKKTAKPKAKKVAKKDSKPKEAKVSKKSAKPKKVKKMGKKSKK